MNDALEMIAGLADVLVVDTLEENELDQLCDATYEAIVDGEDINWVKPPERMTLEAYWKGICLAPHRTLVVARLGGTICGAVQLIRPSAINEAGAYTGTLDKLFLAPAGRGHGLGRALLEKAEELGRAANLKMLDFDLRSDREAAIGLVESLGYQRWAEKPHYAFIDGQYIPGYFYTKMLEGGQPLAIAS